MAVPANAMGSALAPENGAATRAADSRVAGDPQPRPEQYGVGYQTDVPVEMSDGVVLYADIWYPTNSSTGQRAQGKFPVLVEVTPYNPAARRAPDPVAYQRFLVSRGYIYVVGQARGSWGAGGVNCFLCDREKQDGVDFVYWASRLAESNGSVGLAGCSYMGLNQYFTAARLGPGSPVKAMVPTGAGGFLYRQAEFFGGMPNGTVRTLIAGWGALAGSASAAELGLQVGAELDTGGDRSFNRQWWQEREPAYVIEDVVRSGIPVLIRSSWYDEYYSSSSVETYSMLQNAAAGRDVWAPMRPGRQATPRYQLIMGPERHCAFANDPAVLAWFDFWLKGIGDGLSETATPVHLYEMGTDRWVDAPSRYPTVTDYKPLYLNSDGRLTKSKPRPAAGSDRIAWAAPQTGAVLQYTSDPLTHGVTLVGSPVATIYASSSNANLELIAELFDVAPDGTTARLTMGAMIGSMRTVDHTRSWFDANGDSIRPFQTYTQAVPVVPGKVTRYDIQFNARMFALKPGHRLRLVLTTQSDLNTCRDPGVSTCAFPNEPQLSTLENGVYDVQHNVVFDSRLNLPMLPSRSLQTGGGLPSLP
ncbi:CocE/NonD family hydrolase [Acrocarpospora macrocephala]